MTEIETNSKMAPDLSIFISHCHEDKDIADAISTAITDWSNGTIVPFQSSSPIRSPTAGANLQTTVLDHLAKAKVVILLYTCDDRDWTWCFYECGVATDPTTKHKTRIIIFEFVGSTCPNIFSNLIKLSVDETGIEKFTSDFHRDPDFYPDEGVPLFPNLSDDMLKERKKGLWEKWCQLEAGASRSSVQRRRWDMIRISLDLESAEKIQNFDRKSKDFVTTCKLATKLIRKNCKVREAFGGAAAHFNMGSIELDKPLDDLIHRWKRRMSRNNSSKWIDGLYEEMTRGVIDEAASPTWHLMKSAQPGSENWYVPIINHVRVLRQTNLMEFDLYFYRIPVEGSSVKITVK